MQTKNIAVCQNTATCKILAVRDKYVLIISCIPLSSSASTSISLTDEFFELSDEGKVYGDDDCKSRSIVTKAPSITRSIAQTGTEQNFACGSWMILQRRTRLGHSSRRYRRDRRDTRTRSSVHPRGTFCISAEQSRHEIDQRLTT